MSKGSKQGYDISFRLSIKELIEMKRKNQEAVARFKDHPYAVKKVQS